MSDRYENIRKALAEAATPWPEQQPYPHPDDAAVDRFASAMKAKLNRKRQEGRGGWQYMTAEQLSAMLHEHVRKGDPVDVANLAMMLHQNGQVIEPPATVVTEIDALRAEAEQHLRQAMSNGAKARAAYAEVEALREEAAGWERTAAIHAELHDEAERYAEKLEEEVERLRALCAAAYQMAGVHDAPVEWLDALSNAASGRPFSTDGLLPYMPQAVCNAETRALELEREIEALRAEVEEWRSFAEAQVEMRDEVEDHAEDLAKSLAELITWIPSADTYRRLGFDPEAPMRALKRAKLSIGSIGGLSDD